MINNWYAADFETAADNQAEQDEQTYVWAWGINKIDGLYNNFEYGTNILGFFEYTVKNPGTYWFHNEKFDGSFILNFLIKNGFCWSETTDIFAMKSFDYYAIVNNMGQIYKIVYKIENKIVKIQNSLLKIPGTIKKIGESLNIESKGDIDYKIRRDVDAELSEKDLDYLKRDVNILAKAMYMIHLKNKNTKLTIGSDCMKRYTELSNLEVCKTYEDKIFPKLYKKEDKFIRKAYFGGYVYVNPKYQNKMLNNGATFDKNSMYPGVMHSSSGYLFPYGRPKYFKGEYVFNNEYPIYIIRCIITSKLKENRWPTINGGKSFTGHSEYLNKIEDEELVLTYIDLKWLFLNYDVETIKFIDGYMFKAKTGMFDEYIDFYMKLKIQASINKDPVQRQLAKLMLNNLYGKFATNPRRVSKIPLIINGRLKFISEYDYYKLKEEKTGVVQLHKSGAFTSTGYLPVGVFTTAYARNELWKAMNLIWDYFVYSDTDSFHILVDGLEKALTCDVDENRLGAWKHESNWQHGIFLRSKTYAELIDGDWDIKCCGMPSNIKEQINIEDFKIGSCFVSDNFLNRLSDTKLKEFYKDNKDNKIIKIKEGKLLPKQVDGGIILYEYPFTISE